MTRGRFAVLVASFGLAGCNLPPLDPFMSAERALRRGDLLQALRAYDAVSVSHERYPEARAAAGSVELRVRRCHELILEALILRGEWRDEEALAALERARQQWAAEPSIEQWVAATEQRLKLFGKREPRQAAPEGVGESAAESVASAGADEVVPDAGTSDEPAGEVSAASSQATREPQHAAPVVVEAPQQLEPVAVAPAPSGETMPSTNVASLPAEDKTDDGKVMRVRFPDVPTVEPKPVVVAPARPVAPTPRNANGEDQVALALIAVEGRLVEGELGGAIGDLIELSRRFRDEPRVGHRLRRLLHQRALVNYGQGAVAAAIADWRRVLALDPDNESVKSLLQRALSEKSNLSTTRER